MTDSTGTCTFCDRPTSECAYIVTDPFGRVGICDECVEAARVRIEEAKRD